MRYSQGSHRQESVPEELRAFGEEKSEYVHAFPATRDAGFSALGPAGNGCLKKKGCVFKPNLFEINKYSGLSEP